MKLLLIRCVVVLAVGTYFAQAAASSPSPESHQGQKLCPTVSVSCPSDPKYYEPLEFTATVTGGDPNVTPTYDWHVAGGEILEGQGTATIKVRAYEPKSVTGTVRINGFDESCSRTASCSTPIHADTPSPIKFDSYGRLSARNQKKRLNRFVAALRKNLSSQAFIYVYASPESRPGSARKAIHDVKEYLTGNGIAEARIGTLDAGLRDRFIVELWIIPPGAVLPDARPTVRVTEYRQR